MKFMFGLSMSPLRSFFVALILSSLCAIIRSEDIVERYIKSYATNAKTIEENVLYRTDFPLQPLIAKVQYKIVVRAYFAKLSSTRWDMLFLPKNYYQKVNTKEKGRCDTKEPKSPKDCDKGLPLKLKSNDGLTLEDLKYFYVFDDGGAKIKIKLQSDTLKPEYADIAEIKFWKGLELDLNEDASENLLKFKTLTFLGRIPIKMTEIFSTGVSQFFSYLGFPKLTCKDAATFDCGDRKTKMLLIRVFGHQGNSYYQKREFGFKMSGLVQPAFDATVAKIKEYTWSDAKTGCLAAAKRDFEGAKQERIENKISPEPPSIDEAIKFREEELKKQQQNVAMKEQLIIKANRANTKTMVKNKRVAPPIDDKQLDKANLADIMIMLWHSGDGKVCNQYIAVLKFLKENWPDFADDIKNLVRCTANMFRILPKHPEPIPLPDVVAKVKSPDTEDEWSQSFSVANMDYYNIENDDQYDYDNDMQYDYVQNHGFSQLIQDLIIVVSSLLFICCCGFCVGGFCGWCIAPKFPKSFVNL